MPYPARGVFLCGEVLDVEGRLGGFNFQWALPSAEAAFLEVIDVAGRRLLRRDVGVMGPGCHEIDVSSAVRRPGLYFLQLAQAGRVLRHKMVLVR